MISLFPVSPSGGKPGRAGSPHAGEHVARQQKALALAVRPAPPARGAQPPLRIPPCPSPKAHLGLHYFGASEEMKKSLTIAALSDMAHIRQMYRNFAERRLAASTAAHQRVERMRQSGADPTSGWRVIDSQRHRDRTNLACCGAGWAQIAGRRRRSSSKKFSRNVR